MNQEDQAGEENEKLTPEEELNAKNEMDLLRLNLDYGAETFISEDTPPEIVRMFLDNIKEWEQNIKDNPDLVTIRSVLADVTYPDAEQLEYDAYEDAIEEFMQLLLDHGVLIDRPDHLTAREYYFFLTNELLDEEVLAERPPGFIHGLLYSDIKKDHPNSITEIVVEEIQDIFDYDHDYTGVNLGPESEMDTDFLSVLDDVMYWQSQHPNRQIKRLELDEVLDNEDHYMVSYDLEFVHGSKETLEQIAGQVYAKVKLIDGEYYIIALNLPGLDF